MSKTTLTFLFLLGASQQVFSQSRVSLECRIEDSYCYLENISLNESVTSYNIVSPDPDEIFHVVIKNSSFPVITNDFCRAFYGLYSFQAKDQGVKRLASDAFQNCLYLRNVLLEDNQIEVLPEDVLVNTTKILVFRLENNKISTLNINTFEGLKELRVATFGGNRLSAVSPFTLKANSMLLDLFFESNDVTDVDEGGLVRTLRDLKYINFQDNLIPCSRVPYIITAFAQREIEVLTDYVELRNRSVEMDFVEGIRCIKWA